MTFFPWLVWAKSKTLTSATIVLFLMLTKCNHNSPKTGLRQAAAGKVVCFWVVWGWFFGFCLFGGFFLSIEENAPLDFLKHAEVFLAGKRSSASLTGTAPVLGDACPSVADCPEVSLLQGHGQHQFCLFLTSFVSHWTKFLLPVVQNVCFTALNLSCQHWHLLTSLQVVVWWGKWGFESFFFFFFPLVLHYALTLYKTHENLTLLKSQSQGCATLPWIPWCSI